MIKHHVDETTTTVCWTNLDKDLIPTTGCPPKTKNLGKFDTTPAIGVSQLLVGIRWAKLDAEIGSHRSNYLHLPQVLLLIRNLEFTFNIYECVCVIYVCSNYAVHESHSPPPKKTFAKHQKPRWPQHPNQKTWEHVSFQNIQNLESSWFSILGSGGPGVPPARWRRSRPRVWWRDAELGRRCGPSARPASRNAPGLVGAVDR